ncbi:Modification methylase HaeIII [Oligella ureolytica]|uniref:DNA cytosine methyltransferase n=1 Tax=Oligella ureolytica TaxID=90244 RepID=UPI000E069F7F|nr:DNA cytosine methyltransferase [Oligella ureolytica]SUA54781.1 Modification methylase HaeIII [Oligella ureolytica]
MLTSIDLFSGGGGLSEGMRQARFKILSAVENNAIAAETFRINHKKTKIIERDIRVVSSDEILKLCGLNKGELDLLAGCPPCQSFSSLTLNYDNKDKRNNLIMEVHRLTKGLLPKAIMIENVPGIMTRGNAYLKEFIQAIEKLGYIVNHKVLQVADYGVPQNRRRYVLLAGLGFEIKIPEPTHSRADNNLPKWKTVKEAFIGLDQPIPLSKTYSTGGPQRYNWHVVRDISAINLERLKYLKPGGPRYDIPDHLRPKCHQGKNSGFSNVYSRMDWDDVSPTITGGCTVLSKGRFGHPTEMRTISVREAARLQSFPDTFQFATDHIDHATQIIGNALPCDFAKIMSQACYSAIIAQQENIKSLV